MGMVHESCCQAQEKSGYVGPNLGQTLDASCLVSTTRQRQQTSGSYSLGTAGVLWRETVNDVSSQPVTRILSLQECTCQYEPKGKSETNTP